MSNYLGMDKQQLIKHLTNLGWSGRRIEREMSINRRTTKKYQAKFQIQNTPKVPADFLDEKGHSSPSIDLTQRTQFQTARFSFPYIIHIITIYIVVEF